MAIRTSEPGAAPPVRSKLLDRVRNSIGRPHCVIFLQLNLRCRSSSAARREPVPVRLFGPKQPCAADLRRKQRRKQVGRRFAD